MEILGERWTVVVLREVFIGIRRFEDMRVRTGIPRQVLTNRLATLVEHGLLRREPYQEPGARVRHEYRLTDEGPRPLPGAGGPARSGVTATWPTRRARRWRWSTATAARPSTSSCAARRHEVADHRDVVPRPGPGARRRAG